MKKVACVSMAAVMAAFVVSAVDVVQSQREIPVVRECDVVVVGGGSAAVAAAIAAKTNGASVLLVASRSYLGEDVAGTRELWPEPVEELFSVDLANDIFGLTTPYVYTVNVTPNTAHPDPGNTRLTDGVHYDAVNHSVQYDTDAQITATFQGTGTVQRVDVYYYERPTSNPFDTVVSAVHYSLDGVNWMSASISVEVENLGVNNTITTYAARVTLNGGVQAKYMRVFCDIAPDNVRQLLDEIEFITDLADPVPGSYSATTPLDVKQAFQTALESEGIPYMGGSPVTDILVDGNGDPAGVVLVNRKGRQAVRARVVIDATVDAWPARQAGAVKRAFTPGTYSFSRIVMADESDPPAAAGLSVVMLEGVAYDGVPVPGVTAPAGMPASIDGRVYRCSFSTNLTDGSALELLEVEQVMRDMTWVTTCIDQADTITWLPPDSIIGESAETATSWPGAAALDIGAFRPAGVTNLYVVGLRADVPRALAAEMRNPARMMALGQRIGALAATEALGRPAPQDLTLPGEGGLTMESEDVRELLDGLPPHYTNAADVVVEGMSAVPVMAACDVLVIGAGTAGAPAAISAGRAGAETIVLEYLYNMGGVRTDGRIGRYYHGNICGFTVDDVDPGVNATGSVLATSKSEWYRQACREAGVRVIYGSMAVGALVDGNALKGVVIVLPNGERGIIRASAVVDATGNAVIAAAAGEETEFINASEIAVQGAGQARHILGDSYANSDVGFVDDRDVTDVFFFARRAVASMTPGSTWDAGQNPASRERRRLIGVVSVTPIDIMNYRTWPDTIVRPRSNFDSHGYTVHDLFFIIDPGTSDITANLPYRALLPKTLDGLLVAGLGMSCHRDAMPLLRMQPDLQNQGYAAGYAAALAVQAGVTLRNVDMAALQAHLVSKGIIRSVDVATPDSFPLDVSVIQAAVYGLTNNYATLHTVLADVDAALPMLRTRFNVLTDPAYKLIYAHVLGLLYDATGADTLAAAVAAAPWDAGWVFRGMGQYGHCVSQMDSYIIALGRTRDPVGISPVLAKTAQLGSDSAFSHIRAVSLSLEVLDVGSSITALATLLEDLDGFAMTNSLVTPLIPGYANSAGDTERDKSLKEISVARALFKLGDDTGLNGSRILSQYAHDPREIYASHARLVLEEGPAAPVVDGVWISTDSSAEWSESANWKDGVGPNGIGSTAWFTNSFGGTQTIAIDSSIVNIGSLVFAGSDRVLTGGVLDVNDEPPVLDVAQGTHVVIESELLSGGTVMLSGQGTLELSGAATLGGVDLNDGALVLSDPDVQFFTAYSASTNEDNAASADFLSLRCDFRVVESVLITGLGAYDSGGDGFAAFKKVAVYNQGGGTPLEALAFVPGEDYELDGGYRFRQLPEPLLLQPGDYSVVTCGFGGDDRYLVGNQGGIGDMAGVLNSGDGALVFLTNGFSATAGDLAYPTDPFGPDSNYPLTAGTLRFATGADAKAVAGPVTVSSNAVLDLAAVKVTFEQGLYAGRGRMGIVSNASASHAVALILGVPTGVTNRLAGTAIGDRADGPLNLVKDAEGALAFEGGLGFNGGFCVREGLVELEAPGSLGGGDLCFGTGGRLRFGTGGALTKSLYVASQAQPNDHSTGVELAGGECLTLSGGLFAPRLYEYGGFVLQPFDEGAGRTRVALDGALLGYFDLYLHGDGPGGAGAAEHLWTGVRGGLRKLACGHQTTVGSRITFGSGCDFSANWFDVAGSNAVVCITNDAVARVTGQLRFVDGNDSQLSLDGGQLDVRSFGVQNAGNQHLARKPVLFNGTRVRALADNNLFFNLSPASAAPLICDGGALFDTDGYEVAIRGRGFAQAPGSGGAFVKDGPGTLKIATPMSYTGVTIVSNGVLSLDFALWQGGGGDAADLLPPSNVVLCAGGSFRVAGMTNATGAIIQLQRLARLENTRPAAVDLNVEDASLEVRQLHGAFDKSGDGTLAVVCDGSEASGLTGILRVESGTLELRGPVWDLNGSVPYPGFESDPLLPADPISARDKRGTAATGCPGWTFVNSDSGYQRNTSYFSGTAACYATDGVQTAFVRRYGSMNATLVILTNGFYTLRYQYCPRYYAPTWFDNHIVRVSLNGVQKDEVTVTDHFYNESVVDLGELSPGSYTLSFAGDGSLAGDPCTLIDSISVTGSSGYLGADALSSRNWHLMVETAGRIALNYSGLVTVGSLTIDGERYSGVYVTATSHPALVTGGGVLRINQSGLFMILR